MRPNIQLKQFPIFSGLTDDQFSRLAALLTFHDFKPGNIIFEEGDPGDSLHLLLEGEVEIVQALTLAVGKSSVDSREKSIVRLNSESQTFFGEVGLLEEGGRRTATVRATQKCTMAKLSREDFLRLVDDDPVLGIRLLLNIAGVLCDRLRKTNLNVLKITTAFSLALER